MIILLLPLLLFSFSGVNTLAFTSDSDGFYIRQTLLEESYYVVELKAEVDAFFNLTVSPSSNVDVLRLNSSEFNTYQSNFITGKTLDIAHFMDALNTGYTTFDNFPINDGESIFFVIENADYTQNFVDGEYTDKAANCTTAVDLRLTINFTNAQLGINSLYLRQEGDTSSDGNSSDGFLIYSLLTLIPIFVGRRWKKQMN